MDRSFKLHQKLWRTLKHSERTLISVKILWGTKEYSFSSWNWTHTLSVTQGCASKWIQGLNIHCKNQWIPNWTRKITHTHTHTHTQTYANPKCWFTVHYLVSKFLNFHLLNYNVEHTRSHWTPLHPGALHQFPLSEWEVSLKDSYAYLKSGYTQ
jgi:hypothetical protein